MKITFISALVLFCLPYFVDASDTLTVEQCRILALQNSPLQQKKLLAESISTLQINNLRSNSFPRIQVGAQASWQSDVFGLPFNFPGSDIPEVPRDQYKLSVDLTQRIWDGGSDRHLRQQRGLEAELAGAQVEVDVFSLREIVTDLYFKALLLQESEAILVSSKEDFQTRLKQAEAAVSEGIALRTSADQIKIQLLKADQQIAAIQSDKQHLKSTLARWTGMSKSNFHLIVPDGKLPKRDEGIFLSSKYENRPEFRLFEVQRRTINVGKESLSLRNRPRIDGFLQGGLGRPNPFNFFETGFEPFALVGIRAMWNPFDWGNNQREAQILDLQLKTVDVQQDVLRQRLDITLGKEGADWYKMNQQLAQDDAIIVLQTDIIRRVDAQVKNGVVTMTDYLAQVNLLTQAQLTRKTHEVQAAQALEMWKAKTGDR